MRHRLPDPTPAADRRRLYLFLYSVFNIVGLGLYLIVVGGIVERERMEQRDYSDFGDGIIFFCFAVPVFFLCLVVNLFWGVKALLDAFRRKDYQASMALGIITFAWIVLYMLLRFCS